MHTSREEGWEGSEKGWEGDDTGLGLDWEADETFCEEEAAKRLEVAADRGVEELGTVIWGEEVGAWGGGAIREIEAGTDEEED